MLCSIPSFSWRSACTWALGAWPAALVMAAAGCSTQRSILIGAALTDAGPDGAGVCPPTLAGRISVTEVRVEASVGYAERGYDGFPLISRVELSTRSDGSAALAWHTADRKSVVVTPLGQDGTRAGSDVVIESAFEIGGLVASSDGFAILARRPDPGAPLSQDPLEAETDAAFLLGYRGAVQAFSLSLTGTTSPQPSHLYSSRLTGQLAFDGERYGAYFAVRGGAGSPLAGFWGDQMSFASTTGALLAGGFQWGCSENLGNRIVPAANGPYPAVCLTDDTANAGLNWVKDGQLQPLAFEEVWSGYSAGSLGGLVGLPDGSLVVVWSSRGDGGVAGGGVVDDGGPPLGSGVHRRAKDAPDIAWLHLNADGSPRGPVVWLTETPDLAEFGVHIAPYGSGRYLLEWSALRGCRYLNGNCYGDLAGTFARLVDADGNALTSDEPIAAWPPDNSGIAVYPNGDLGWAYVDPRPSYGAQLVVADLPASTSIHVARLRVCP